MCSQVTAEATVLQQLSNAVTVHLYNDKWQLEDETITRTADNVLTFEAARAIVRILRNAHEVELTRAIKVSPQSGEKVGESEMLDESARMTLDVDFDCDYAELAAFA